MEVILAVPSDVVRCSNTIAPPTEQKNKGTFQGTQRVRWYRGHALEFDVLGA
jgi:hypothetical protein